MIKRLLRQPLAWIAGIVVIALGAYLAFGVFGIQALFIDKEVNEDFPVAQAAAAPAAAPTAAPEPTAVPATAQSAPSNTTSTEQPAAPTSVPEPTSVPTPSGPVLVSQGQFHAVAHAGSGDALIYQQPDGTYVLRLENLDVENGPDLYVYAAAVADANDADSIVSAGFINVGQLKGNKGNQTYTLPTDFDPAVHRAISIWCQRFTVNFATAPLQ